MELAQILSPLTQSYSLRIFNDSFQLSTTRYVWHYARWYISFQPSSSSPNPNPSRRLTLTPTLAVP